MRLIKQKARQLALTKQEQALGQRKKEEEK